jgi:hypothetical protein
VHWALYSRCKFATVSFRERLITRVGRSLEVCVMLKSFGGVGVFQPVLLLDCFPKDGLGGRICAVEWVCWLGGGRIY